MPVTKFRSVEEMNRLAWRPAGSPELVRAIKSVLEFGRRLSPRKFPPGVRKFKSVDDLKASSRA